MASAYPRPVSSSKQSPVLPILAAVLTVVTAYLVYAPATIGLDPTNGLYVLWVSVPLAMLIVYRMTAATPGRWEDALGRFARFEQTRLKKVPALPGDLAEILVRAGDGKPVAYFEIHPRLAYVAVTEADIMNASDSTTVLMKLEANAPSFGAHPLVAADPPPPDIVAFTKDADFTARYVVQSAYAQKTRSFLSEPLRAELCDFPSVWVEAEKTALALSIYGDFDAAKANRLVEAADVFFAEYGAGGGPTLLEPAGAPKKKKKKKKKPDAPAGEPTESPA